ncbi:hypothetical protein ABFA07_020816 [Porites harrisoni]
MSLLTSFCLHLDEYSGTEWKKFLSMANTCKNVQEDEWTRCMDCTLNQGRSLLAARRTNEEGDQRTSLQIKLKGRTDGGTSLK